MIRGLHWAVLRLCFLIASSQAFSWGAAKQAHHVQNVQTPLSRPDNASPSVGTQPRLSNKYSMALRELEELESEPLCHRIAARLLVNNCQLLDGQDEATILVDSGRATRDFVDFYAASLAICDLERGSFVIPPACSSFREATLAGISPPTKPQLHVTSSEIDGCLEGLAQSDSAWNTWVSYRHKALRFCEAARVDNEKDQQIYLYQRVTNIIAKLTTQVEEELESRMHSLDRIFRNTASSLESMTPHLEKLKNGLLEVDTVMVERISRGAQESASSIRGSLEDAKNLQQLLETLLTTLATNEVEIFQSHESALQVATKQVGDEISVIATALAAAAASSSLLRQEIENSESRAIQTMKRQTQVEMGMRKLEELANTLFSKQQSHQERLVQAQETTEQVLSTLDSISASTATFQSSIFGGFGLTSWWPYLFCPVTTLVIGSYGLPPSAVRNFLLISLGEVVGVVFSMVSAHNGESSLAVASHHAGPNHYNESDITRASIYKEGDLTSLSDIAQAILTKGYH